MHRAGAALMVAVLTLALGCSALVNSELEGKPPSGGDAGPPTGVDAGDGSDAGIDAGGFDGGNEPCMEDDDCLVMGFCGSRCDVASGTCVPGTAADGAYCGSPDGMMLAVCFGGACVPLDSCTTADPAPCDCNHICMGNDGAPEGGCVPVAWTMMTRDGTLCGMPSSSVVPICIGGTCTNGTPCVDEAQCTCRQRCVGVDGAASRVCAPAEGVRRMGPCTTTGGLMGRCGAAGNCR